jgi:hypothetical protein
MKRASILAMAVVLLAGYAYAGTFTDNGNGTVTDKNTGLMWQKEDDGNSYNWYVAAGVHDAKYNPTTKSVCGELTLAGYSAWRLPSNAELMSIVDSSIQEPGPTIDAAYFPGTKSSVYWSSSTQEAAALGTVFRSGNIFVGHRGANIWYVRCVRDGK